MQSELLTTQTAYHPTRGRGDTPCPRAVMAGRIYRSVPRLPWRVARSGLLSDPETHFRDLGPDQAAAGSRPAASAARRTTGTSVPRCDTRLR